MKRAARPAVPVAAKRPEPSVLHPAAWLTWACSVMVVAWTTTNPFYLGLLLLCVVLVAVLAPRTRTGALGLRVVATFGVIMLALSVAIATINGASGDHVIFTMPGPNAPSWMGGLRIGGPVTWEALTAAFSRGLAILSVFLAFAVFNAAVAPSRMLRLAPAALFHASLIVTIGLALLPSSIEDVRRIREMRALRGATFGLRDLPGIAVPAVIGGLERSMRLAEALEARGFAAREAGSMGQRLGIILPAPLALASTWLWFYQPDLRWLAATLGLAAAGSFGLWLRSAARASNRTSFHESHWSALDRAGTVLAAAVAAVAFGAAQGELFGLGYNPWAGLEVPDLHAAGLALIVLSAWPVAGLLTPATAAATAPVSAPEAAQ